MTVACLYVGRPFLRILGIESSVSLSEIEQLLAEESVRSWLAAVYGFGAGDIACGVVAAPLYACFGLSGHRVLAHVTLVPMTIGLMFFIRDSILAVVLARLQQERPVTRTIRLFGPSLASDLVFCVPALCIAVAVGID